MKKRINLTSEELQLIEVFRKDRNIYNSAIEAAVEAIMSNVQVSGLDPVVVMNRCIEAVLSLKKED